MSPSPSPRPTPGPSQRDAPRRFLDLRAATLLVIANMIGTGVFTTLGLQAAGVADGAALLLIWLLGGLIALCGALSYAELAAALPCSGGEYHFLSRIYSPRLGELAGWVSLLVGFAAPMALSAMAFGRYVGNPLGLDPVGWAMPLALAAVTLVCALHALDLELGRRFQVLVTLLKVGLILVFCAVGLWLPAAPGSLGVVPGPATADAILSAPFALSLIYVTYAYSGWNAATYVTAEVQDAQRQVPRALILGTLGVTLLYLLLNLVFLRSIPAADLSGTIEVGALAASHVFGTDGGRWMSLALGLLLVSSISAMAMAGPRVIEAMAADLPGLARFGQRSRRGAPLRAVALLWLVAVAFILTDAFAAVLALTGFTLTAFALLTVLGVLRLRRRQPHLPRPFRVPWYPLPPLVFAGLATASLLTVAITSPLPVLTGTTVLALVWWFLGQRRRQPRAD